MDYRSEQSQSRVEAFARGWEARLCVLVYRKLMSESVRLSCCPSVHLSRTVGCTPKTDRKNPSVGNLTLISVHPFFIKYIYFFRRSIKWIRDFILRFHWNIKIYNHGFINNKPLYGGETISNTGVEVVKRKLSKAALAHV